MSNTKLIRGIQTAMGVGLMVVAFAAANSDWLSAPSRTARTSAATTGGFVVGSMVARLGDSKSTEQAKARLQPSDDPRSVALASIARSLSGRR